MGSADSLLSISHHSFLREKKMNALRLLVPKFNLLSLSTTRTLVSTTPAFKAYEHLPQQQGHMPPGSMGFGGKAQGKAPNWDKRRKGWVCVRVMSQAGTGSSMTVVRHERDPKVVMIAADPKLPAQYEDDARKVIWIETKKMNKVFPGSRVAEKRVTKEQLRSNRGYQFLPKEGEMWRRQIDGSSKFGSQKPKYNDARIERDERQEMDKKFDQQYWHGVTERTRMQHWKKPTGHIDRQKKRANKKRENHLRETPAANAHYKKNKHIIHNY